MNFVNVQILKHYAESSYDYFPFWDERGVMNDEQWPHCFMILRER